MGRETLTREDWLEAALDALEEEGAGGLKVLPLSKRLGVSRSSFYWQFADQRELAQAVLDYWDEWSTQAVIDALAAAPDVEPKERIWLLMDLVLDRRLARHDTAIRAWALHDDDVARVVRRVDRRRIRTVKQLFDDVGFSPDQAAARARLLASYLIGSGLLLAPESRAREKTLARLRWQILVEKVS